MFYTLIYEPLKKYAGKAFCCLTGKEFKEKEEYYEKKSFQLQIYNSNNF